MTSVFRIDAHIRINVTRDADIFKKNTPVKYLTIG